MDSHATDPAPLDNDQQSDSDVEEEQLPTVEDPSQSIRTDLENVLSEDLEFDGSFYFSKACPDAPNPFLRIDGAGRIGLPLNEREAKHIISFSRQAPFGKGERTLVDTTVRDTWEIDAAQVHFDNASWATYMDGIVKQVCETLGVHYDVSKPRCELYKLLVYETGSHFLPHQDTEKADGMFATIIVILPSEFTGGAVHVSHGEISAVADHSQNSFKDTAVISWYTDVKHEVKPITSGYRLALAYNLIHTTTALRPSLSDNNLAMQRLRHILLSWQQDLESNPKKLVYLLDHTYSQANLRASALKGSDANCIALLDSLVEECQIRLGLATIECHVSGVADDDWGRREQRERNWPRWHDYGSEEDEDAESDEDDVSMAEICERTMSITNLVDLDGHRLKAKLDVVDTGDEDEDEEDLGETIPENLREQVEEGTPDEQDYEGYQGNGAGSLERWYRRTVLVIWPRRNDGEVIHGKEYGNFAAGILAKTISTKPTKEERTLLRYLLGLPKQDATMSTTILRSVCRAACQWRDKNLWLEAIKKFDEDSRVTRLRAEDLAGAVLAFGLDAMTNSILAAIKMQPSNTRVFNLWDGMEAVIADPDCKAWIQEQRRTSATQNLRGLGPDEGPLMLNLARRYGGTEYLFDVLIPQVVGYSQAKDMLSFVRALCREPVSRDGLLRSEEDDAYRKTVVRHILEDAILRTDFFEAVPIVAKHGYHPTYGYDPKPRPTSDLAFQYIQECHSAGNPQLVESIARKLVAPRVPDPSQPASSLDICLVLLPRLNPLLATEPPKTAVSGLEALYSFAIAAYVERLKRSYGSITKEEITTLANASLYGGIKLLSGTIIPGFNKAIRDTQSVKSFVMELRRRKDGFGQSAAQLPAIITGLLKPLVERVNHAEVVDLMDFCIKYDNRQLCQDLLTKLVQPQSMTAYHLQETFLPLLSRVATFLDKINVPRTHQPFASFFKIVMTAWAKKVLGSVKPSEAQARLQAVQMGRGCSCADCAQIVRFFQAPQPTLTLSRIGAPRVKHLHIAMKAARGVDAVATCETVRTTPQTFTITWKPDIQATLKWKVNRDRGIATLKGVSSDEGVLSTILGTDYVKLCGLLDVRFINRQLDGATQAAATPAPAVSSRATATAVQKSVPKTSRPNPPEQRSSTSRPSTHLEQLPPRKKRKTDTSHLDVIDLTSP